MKELTIVALIPPGNNSRMLKKVWVLKSYLMEEINLRVNVVVGQDSKGKPRIIALGEIIDLNEDIQTIAQKIASTIVYDVGDPEFINKVAIGGKTVSE